MNLLYMITYCVAFTIAEQIQIQKYLLLENENVFSSNSIVVFPLKDYQNIENLDSTEFSLFELKDTIIRPKFTIQNLKSIIFNDNGDELAIMTINNNEMICLIQMNTYLIDDELSYQNCKINFKFQLQNCSLIHQISNNELIILCFQHSKIMTLLLQNFQNQVISKYELEILEQIQNCKHNLIAQDQNIIIYQTNCNMAFIQIFKIENENINIYYNNSLQSLLQLEQIQFQELGQLISIQICFKQNLVLIFENNRFLCTNFVQDCLQFYPKNQLKPTVKSFDYCQSGKNLERTKEGQWFFKNGPLKFVIDGYEDSILVDNKLIIYSKQELQIFLSPKVSNKIQIQVQDIIPIGNLHYFALLNIQGELQIYKLVKEQFYFSNFNSSSKYIVKKFSYDFYLKERKYDVVEIEEYTQQNPLFLINNKKINPQIRFFQNNLCFYRNLFQESIPFEISNVRIDEINVKYQYQTKGFSCKYNNKELYQKLWLIEDQDQREILILEDSQKLKIYICFKGVIVSRFIIAIHMNYVRIVISQEFLSFCIIYRNEFQCYQFNDLSLLHKSIAIKEKINKMLIYKNKIILILDNCKIIQLKLNDFQSIFENFDFIHPFCTEIQYIICVNQVITVNSIIRFIDGMTTTLQKLPDKILEFVSYTDPFNLGEIIYFLIFLKQQEDIYISLYFSFLNQSRKLYDLPLYEYQIKFPIIYEYQGSILLILAQDKQANDYLLVYNCSTISIKSLVQIIRIDKVNQYFGFINSKLDFFFIQKGSIVIQNINQICLTFENNFHLKDTSFIKQFKFDLTLQASLKQVKQKEQIKFTQKFLNMNQSLLLLKEDFVKIDSNGYIDLINIYGTINQIEVLEKDQFLIIPPFDLCQTTDKIFCFLYTNNLCIHFDFSFHQIYFNITQQFQIAVSQYNYCRIYFDQLLESYVVIEIVGNYYINEKKIRILKFEFDKINTGNESFNQLKEISYLIPKESTYLVRQIVEILNINGIIIVVNDILERYLIILADEQDKLIKLDLFNSYVILDGYFIRNSTYLFIATNPVELYLVIYSFNYQNSFMNQTILFTYILNYSQIFLDHDPIFFTLKLNLIKIIFADISINLLQVKAFLFFNEFLAFSVELHFDILKQILIKSYISSIFRYKESSTFEALLYLDENFMIIKILNKSRQLLVVYDLSLISQKTELDSIYQFQDKNYTLIEKHNQTHHIIIQFENEALQINFIQLSKYQIKCIKECQQLANLQLQNDINSLIVQTMIFNQKSIFNFQGIIIFFCFIFIIFHTKKRNN